MPRVGGNSGSISPATTQPRHVDSLPEAIKREVTYARGRHHSKHEQLAGLVERARKSDEYMYTHHDVVIRGALITMR